MKIAFFHNGLAFLPELEAYVDFFQKKNIHCQIITPDQQSLSDFDVEWHFMGTGKRRKKNSILIHEYGSLSIPPFSNIKDLLKKQLNEKPDFRIYLNEVVQKKMNFKDNIPFGFRDMGIDPDWSDDVIHEKKYDFIYVGSSNPHRNLKLLLNVFSEGKMNESSLLVLSKDYEILKNLYSSISNIIFKGPVSRKNVYGYLKSSRYGLNFISDRHPFNIQTSTKFLEYCQVQIPVISTDYFWIRSFQEQFGGNYYYLKPDLSNFNKNSIEAFSYSWPELSSWSWEEQISKSGILNFLLSK